MKGDGRKDCAEAAKDGGEKGQNRPVSRCTRGALKPARNLIHLFVARLCRKYFIKLYRILPLCELRDWI